MEEGEEVEEVKGRKRKKGRDVFVSHHLASVADVFWIDIATPRPWAGTGGRWGSGSGYAARASRKATRT
jgi:hypothetical protein